MGRLGYNDNDHYFELSSDRQDPIVLNDDVLNWDNDDKSYERDPEGGGTLRKINTKVEIVGKDVNYIDTLLSVYGYDSTATITHKAKSRTKIGEDWETVYSANLDLMLGKFSEDGKKRFSAPFTQGGLYDKIKARFGDTYDLVNRKSADDKDISELSTIIEQVKGREIYRRTELEVEDYSTQEIKFTGGGEHSVRAVPFTVKEGGGSDAGHIDGITPGAEKVPYANNTYQEGQVGTLLYFKADSPQVLILDGKILARMLDTHSGYLAIEEIRYNSLADSLIYVQNSRKELGRMSTGTSLAQVEVLFDNYEIALNQGESCAIVCFVNISNFIGAPKVKWEYQDTHLSITNHSTYPRTEAKAVLPFEMFDRLLEKITGEKGLLKSNLLGRKELGYKEDGEWSTLAVGSGFWARGFDIGGQRTDANGELIPLKQFNTSLRDAYDSLNAILPLMWGVERINGKEYFRLEKYEYTQQAFTGVRLGRTINGEFQYTPAVRAERTFLTDNIFTKVDIGYEKGGSEYEEVFGLTAPHGKAQFNTSLKNVKANTYIKVSKFRADLEGYELARIKQAQLYPDEDTAYDQDLFFRHLIKQGTSWRLRRWQDDFIEAPKFIYSPDTTGNLLLTPLRCALRHGRILATSVFHDQYGKFTWISSNCNSDLEAGGLKESSAVLNSVLGDPFITGELLTFEGFVFPETIEQLEGFTFVGDERIPNWYGLFEFMHNGRLVRGKLVSSKITGNGKHEIALV